MKSFFTVAALALASLTASVTAQRITGDSACVNNCYQISVAVTQCPDLTDNGVISCICPNSTQVNTLNSCHSCITSLSGVTDLETNSINTLFNACAGNAQSSGVSSGAGSNANAQTSSSGAANPAQTTAGDKPGAGAKTMQTTGAAALSVVAVAIAAFVTL